jgi:ATP-dependent DNA ligase
VNLDISPEELVKEALFRPTTMPIRNRPTATISPPAWIKPQLAQLVKAAPDGSGWLHEIKLDGYRMHARLDAGRVQILTRRGNDWTDKYPAIAKALTELATSSTYLDGELCGVLPDGRTAFNLIQNALEHGDCNTCILRVRSALPGWRRPDQPAAGRPQGPTRSIPRRRTRQHPIQ